MRSTRPVARTLWLAAVLAAVFAAAGAALAADWPAYRHDASRSGIAGESLAPPLALDWVFVPTAPPEHAWGDPQPKPVERVLELPRMRFDDAFHVAAAGASVYFGSSADGHVYALDARTGAVRWRFATEGPIRCAPTAADGRVYVGSDDGRVYCLSAKDGGVVWTFDATPTREMVLGNGRMISLWPVRTGVAVAGGAAVFGAGVFPGEGLFLYAVDAATGAVRWKNDTYGRGGMGTISPQGYLLISADRLFLPSGRAMPAAFDASSGEFLYQPTLNWRGTGLFGGTYNVLADGLLFNGTEQITVIDAKSGRMVFNEGLAASANAAGTRRLVVAEECIYMLDGKDAVALDRQAWTHHHGTLRDLADRINRLNRDHRRLQAEAQRTKEPGVKAKADRIPAQIKQLAADRQKEAKAPDTWTRWRKPSTACDAVALAGDTLLVGGDGTVIALAADTGEETWSAKVDGCARGLAVAEGRLLVSTDTGRIYAFIPGAEGAGKTVKVEPVAAPFPQPALNNARRQVAEDMVKSFDLARGYGLVLGGDGRLALELARKTDLHLLMPVADAKRADAIRKALTAGGVAGSGVTVMHCPAGPLPYSDYFANLVICEAGFFAGEPTVPAEDVATMLKPCGGVILLENPSPGAKPPAGMQAWMKALAQDLERVGEAEPETATAQWVALRRGALKDAGQWTHEYGDVGNTASSDDALVRAPLGVLWFGRPGPGEMPSRHASNASPLAVGGRMFVEGENVVLAYDAYNGVPLWRREMPGAQRLGLKTNCSNLAARDDALFVAVGERCLRLDPATGRTVRTYQPPEGDAKPAWRYVAVVGNLLLGSTRGGLLFALDTESGAVRWQQQAGTLLETTICAADGRVIYVDKKVTAAQRDKALAGIDPKKRIDNRGKPVPADVRLVVALDMATGEPLWQRPVYVGDCVKISQAGGDLTAMAVRGVVLLCGQPWNGHFWKEFMAGEFSRRSLIALDAADGHELWSDRKGYRSRPLVVGDTIYAEPWAYDLRTGEARTRRHPITGAYGRWQMSRPGHHCGNIAGCPNTLFFRSGSTAYYDLASDDGTAHFGAHRPGCWINCIPACGLVLMPEAASGCICPFALQCTVAFKHRTTSRVWGMASADGPVLPVRHLAVNFGAPGDRRAPDGTLWLAYPRPYADRLVLVFDLPMATDGGRADYETLGNSDWLTVAGTDTPWLYANALTGSKTITITVPLASKAEDVKPGEKPAKAAYTVRLHFCAPARDEPGQRIFSVLLDKQVAIQDLDVVKEAGGPQRALVKTIEHVRAGPALTIRLQAAGDDPGADARPLLAAMEILRE